jgi:cytochrome c oxidase subunit 3/cytochrome o ubiquinol oxidase subunit 3
MTSANAVTPDLAKGATTPRHPTPPPIVPERNLTPAQWGMLSFLLSEVALFSTLIVTYIIYIGKSVIGPYPNEVLSLPLVLGTTACLLTSSVTIHLAEMALHKNNRAQFIGLWGITIALGVAFLAGTGYEWAELLHHNPPLTISRNLFGTTYYTLVGLHALHVTGGVVLMLIIFILALRYPVSTHGWPAVGLISWYWHFVDVVWIVVFLVVYVIGR